MKKGQAAMEYLMTYGWAILIVIVVVAALYAMGVFRLGGTTTPCSPCFGTQFAYVDYADGTLKLTTGAREINLLNLTHDQATLLDTNTTTSWQTASIAGANNASSSTSVTPGTTLTVTGFESGTTYSITMAYRDVDSALAHTETATLRA